MTDLTKLVDELLELAAELDEFSGRYVRNRLAQPLSPVVRDMLLIGLAKRKPKPK